jgi:hypothetical protein
MKSPFSPFLATAAALAGALMMVACGGSGGDDTPAEDPTLVPRSATGSTAAWFKFASALAPSDSAEALLLTGVGELPTSETEEPTALPR